MIKRKRKRIRNKLLKKDLEKDFIFKIKCEFKKKNYYQISNILKKMWSMYITT